MARRSLLVVVLVVLAQLATGCCKKCKHHLREKHGFHGAAAIEAPCGCSCSSPVGAVPVIVSGSPVITTAPAVGAPVIGTPAVSEPLPTPKKMLNGPNI